eukprot:gene8256-8444_t
MFGGPWEAGLAVANHEPTWQQFGDIKKVALFYNENVGCIEGVVATHGTGESKQSVLLGVDTEQGRPLLSQQLKLQALEAFQGLAYKTGSCIEYLRLTTNTGRFVEIGDVASMQPLQAGTTSLDGGFLAYLRGFTHTKPGMQQGPLQRLQLVWALRDCGAAPEAADISRSKLGLEVADDVQLAGRRQTQHGSILREVLDSKNNSNAHGPMTVAFEAGRIALDSHSNTSFLTRPTAAKASSIRPAPCRPKYCSNGLCPTSGCALNALGKDVMAMACFGTNVLLNPVLEMTVGNPCLNLACKLERPNCHSAGLFGIGGFCTGRVAAVEKTARLHPVGRAFLGYPCIEHKGPVVNMIPIGDRTARGTYVSKAWKVCDCINDPDVADSSVISGTSKWTGAEGDSSTLELSKASDQFGNFTVKPKVAATKLTTTPALQVLLAKLLNIFPPLTEGSGSIFDPPTVLLQWINGLKTSQELPVMAVEDEVMQALQVVVPGVALGQPCLLVLNVSTPLFFGNSSASGIEGLPKAVLVPDVQAWQLQELLPDITALPTIIVPKVLLEEGIQVPNTLLEQVTLPLVTQALYGVTSRSHPSAMAAGLASLFELGAAGAAKLDGLLPFLDFNVTLPKADTVAAVAALLDGTIQQAAAVAASNEGLAMSNSTGQIA